MGWSDVSGKVGKDAGWCLEGGLEGLVEDPEVREIDGQAQIE